MKKKKRYKVYKSGTIRANKVKYSDGIGCCIWQPFTNKKEDEGVGLCWDFSFSDIDDILKVLTQVKKAQPDIYEDHTNKTKRKR